MAIYKPRRHNLSHAERLYRGKNFNESVLCGLNGGEPGVEIHPTTKVHLGSPVAPLTTGLVNGATSTQLPNAATITYTPATSGTAPLNSGSIPTPITLYPINNDPLVWPLAEASTNAGSFTIGAEYCILTSGTTDYSQCGSRLGSNPGNSFIAVNAGSGSGTAAHITPRNIAISATHATSLVAMTVTVSGYDKYMQAMTETLSITATGTSKTATGNKAFAFVSSIAITSAGNATTNTLNVGWGSKLGLPYALIDKSDVLSAYFNDAPDSAWPTLVTYDATTPPTSTTGDVRGTVTMASTLNGSPVELWLYVNTAYLSNPVVLAQA
jgi:hypothetical protein